LNLNKPEELRCCGPRDRSGPATVRYPDACCPLRLLPDSVVRTQLGMDFYLSSAKSRRSRNRRSIRRRTAGWMHVSRTSGWRSRG